MWEIIAQKANFEKQLNWLKGLFLKFQAFFLILNVREN